MQHAQNEASFDADGHGTSEHIAESSQQESQNRAQKRGKQCWAERLKRFRGHADRLKDWLASHAKKIGRQGKEVKSHIIDNESAKMATSHGVIQGDHAQAVVDGKHHVIVGAEAFGDGQDGEHLSLVLKRPAPCKDFFGSQQKFNLD